MENNFKDNFIKKLCSLRTISFNQASFYRNEYYKDETTDDTTYSSQYLYYYIESEIIEYSKQGIITDYKMMVENSDQSLELLVDVKMERGHTAFKIVIWKTECGYITNRKLREPGLFDDKDLLLNQNNQHEWIDGKCSKCGMKNGSV